ncbi:gluconate 2-dehydrogenase subunit 3 family protein [Microbacterium aoyamense]|uniref:Gluconate 2-dehydrogenase subunit 3 family protein n=1 Tax=Microbacterium aoyamense TaxID=344166 RepID=A0ABN2PVY9_9MICO|nr:gluconate 2-dehydrogenase subunit 3 family protein [Microbacterium aoyamense]
MTEDELGTFFTPEQHATVAALVADIIPSDDEHPGAREAGVVDFIDGALAGHDAAWQPAYTVALTGLADYCLAEFGGTYETLADDARGVVLAGLSAGELNGTDATWTKGFFGVLWQHTVQGFLCDPVYGGNKDMVGWKAVGFPGAQYGYGPEFQYGRGTPLPMPVPREAMKKLAEEHPEKFFNAYSYSN